MTIVEFLHPIKSSQIRDICLASLYYVQRYDGQTAITVEDLRRLLKRAHIKNASKINLADILSRSAPYVESPGRQGHRFLWSLTSTGQTYIRSILSLPEADAEIEHDVYDLKTLVDSISDIEVSDYVKESIICLSVNALRASVVFLWSAAIRDIQQKIIIHNLNDINISVQKYDPKAKQIKRIEDLSYIKESTALLVAQDLGIFDKNQRDVLEQALNLRNKCGHPGKYKLGPKKVSSFIEDIVGILFQ
jgi:hypothetical protein